MLNWLQSSSTSPSPFNFHIIYTQPPIESSSNLTITCYIPNQQTAIPCKYAWSRVKHNKATPITHCKGNTYLCEPDDIGWVVEATVTSLDEEFSGVARVRFGPVVIDAMLKRSVERMLQGNKGTFPVRVRDKECGLELRQGDIRINCESNGAQFRFPYHTNSPCFQLSPSDPLRLSISLPPTPTLPSFLSSLSPTLSSRIFPPTLTLCFISRISRDLFLLLHKAFCTKKHLPIAYLMQNLNGLAQQQQFDYLLEIDQLRREVLRGVEENEKIHEEREKYQNQVGRLQEEMRNMKEMYTRIIEERWGLEMRCGEISVIQREEDRGEETKRDQVIEFGEDKPKQRKMEVPTSPKNGRLRTQQSDDLEFSKSHRINTPKNANKTLRKQSHFAEQQELRAKLEEQIRKTRDLSKLVQYYTNMCSTLDQSQKLNKQLRKQNLTLQLKIQQLSKQLDQVNTHSSSNLDDQQGKSNPKSKSSGGSLTHQLEAYKQGYTKYKKKYEQSLNEIKLLRRGNEQLARSRQMSFRMDNFLEEERNTMKEQCELLTEENRKLQQMCGKYWTVTDEVQKLKAEVEELRKRQGEGQ